jgi:hypothetical protein
MERSICWINQLTSTVVPWSVQLSCFSCLAVLENALEAMMLLFNKDVNNAEGDSILKIVLGHESDLIRLWWS